MKFSLIVCTYMRPLPLLDLLSTVGKSTQYPNEILIIDGSTNSFTEDMLKENYFKNLQYFKVDEANRGLTKQRNFGVLKITNTTEVVCFLDDDTLVENDYFEKLIETYKTRPDALGVGGYITNGVTWRKLKKNEKTTSNQFAYDGWVRKDGSRFVLRKKLGLDADTPPAHLPEFSNGRSVSFLPPSGKIYPVDQFMGGVASYKKNVLDKHKFSEYFKGYGLYEDAHFTLKLSNEGCLYVNTAAQLEHHHNESGRPNQYSYGKMVIRNGWFVWRTKHPNPSLKAKLKWNAIAILLTSIRFTNVITSKNKKEAFTEAIGRTIGWWGLLFNKPKLD